jgi:hypothetical protein
MKKLTKPILRIGLALSLLFLVNQPVYAYPRLAGGTILSLTASDAPGHGDTVNIASQVRADTKIQNSNLYYEITIGATLVTTHETKPPSMQIGDTFSDSWSTSNSGFPSIGTYTVTLCWSTGNAHNCDITSGSTTFYSVPTLGWPLSLIGVAILGGWLWKRRDVIFEDGE